MDSKRLNVRSKIVVRWTTAPGDLGYDGPKTDWLTAPGKVMGVRKAAAFHRDYLDGTLGLQGTCKAVAYFWRGKRINHNDLLTVVYDSDYKKENYRT